MIDNTPLANTYELIAEAHAKIQQDFSHIDPIVSVNTQMRKRGVPADAVTIDCLKSGKRILLIFHDEQPELVSYQFCFKDNDPYDEFEYIPHSDLTTQQLYNWMKERFLVRH